MSKDERELNNERRGALEIALLGALLNVSSHPLHIRVVCSRSIQHQHKEERIEFE